MDHAEKVAKDLFECVVIGARMAYYPGQSRGEHDFDLYHPDGHIAAVEVTSSVDRNLEETHSAILDKSRGGTTVEAQLCKHSWRINPSSNTRINRLRKDADRYLADIEAVGLKKFWGPTACDPSVEAICSDLGVISGSVISGVAAGRILIALPGVRGAFGVSTVIEAAEREAFKADNRRKLGAVKRDERYLAVYMYMTNLPWVALVDLEPPLDVPKLPAEVTKIWVFSEGYREHEYIVWRAGTSILWQKLKLTSHI